MVSVPTFPTRYPSSKSRFFISIALCFFNFIAIINPAPRTCSISEESDDKREKACLLTSLQFLSRDSLDIVSRTQTAAAVAR